MSMNHTDARASREEGLIKKLIHLLARLFRGCADHVDFRQRLVVCFFDVRRRSGQARRCSNVFRRRLRWPGTARLRARAGRRKHLHLVRVDVHPQPSQLNFQPAIFQH